MEKDFEENTRIDPKHLQEFDGERDAKDNSVEEEESVNLPLQAVCRLAETSRSQSSRSAHTSRTFRTIFDGDTFSQT